MTYRHYVEARPAPGAVVPGGMFAIAAALCGGVHRINARLPAHQRLAMAFPDLGEEGMHPANRIRILGSNEDVFEDFLADPVVSGITQRGLLRRTLREAFDDTALAAFVRTRLPEKGTHGAAERSHRRAQRAVMTRLGRGEAVQTMPMPLQARYEAAQVRERSLDATKVLHLRMRSSSSGQAFSLFVERMEGVAPSGQAVGLDVYGFSRAAAPLPVPL